MEHNDKPKTYAVKGMHCASCAVNIEKTFKKIDGVSSAEANYGTETVKVDFDPEKTSPEALSESLKPLGYSLAIPPKEEQKMDHSMHNMSAADMGMSEDEHAAHTGAKQSKAEKIEELNDFKRKMFSLLPLAAFSIFIMVWDILAQVGTIPAMTHFWSEFFHHLLPIFATYTLFVVGKPYLLGVYRFIRYGKANMDSLIGIGTLAAFIYSFVVTAFEESLAPYINVEHTYYDVTIVVIAFITLGKYLEARSKLKTGDAIEKLLELQAKTALVIRDGKEVEISINEVVHGDLIVVKPSNKIPVDGVITEGESHVDESMVSGEPNPVSKKLGDTVVAGTINTTGAFTFKATKVGSETLLSHIITMVQEAQSSKAPIQALADKISGVFVPIVVVIAFATLGIWLLIGSQYLGFSHALSYGLVSFVGVLVIACPCALGLATPTAIIVGVGKGAREGILIKDAATLEKLHNAKIVVVDKTGTLTEGKPKLLNIHAHPKSGLSEEKVLALLASLEQKSEHPIASAIVNAAKEKNLTLETVEKFEAVKGKGIQGTIAGTEYFAGSLKMIRELGIEIDAQRIGRAAHEGKTLVLLATKNELLAIAMIADALKDVAVQAVKDLHALGIRVVMLTGDNQSTAEYIAKQAGIDEVIADVLPEDKLKKIQELQAGGSIVAMAGDGVNDAPALAAADVGIAMSTGTDVAIESAGITLLGGDISKLVKAIRLSKLTMRGIRQNLFWAFIYNIVGIPLASGLFFPLFGWLLSPVFAGFAMAMSSVSVVGNSLRLKTKKL